MTAFQISGTREGVGRHGKNDHAKSVLLRFRPKLRDAFDAVLREGEDRTNAIIALIEGEIRQRGGEVPPVEPPDPQPRKPRKKRLNPQ